MGEKKAKPASNYILHSEYGMHVNYAVKSPTDLINSGSKMVMTD